MVAALHISTKLLCVKPNWCWDRYTL